jgi:predicted RNA binding protein YcfA (HicA-like mRNA interferase family)
MSQLDKLIARFRARPPEIDFGDVETLLRALGWTLARERGSHVSFTKEGESASIVVAKNHRRKVKRTYIVEICNILKLDE